MIITIKDPRIGEFQWKIPADIARLFAGMDGTTQGEKEILKMMGKCEVGRLKNFLSRFLSVLIMIQRSQGQQQVISTARIDEFLTTLTAMHRGLETPLSIKKELAKKRK